MSKPILLTVNLPFSGFYGSEYSEAVDHAESSWAEYHADESNGETDDDYESAWPAPLRLDLGDLIYRHADYSAAYRDIARDYVAAFDDLAGEAFGMTRPAKRRVWRDGAMTSETYDAASIGMTFESMDSPREYNFSTDRVYGLIPLKVMRELFRRSKAEGHATLAAVVADRFTSRSGFISSYPSDLGDWLAEAGRLQDWDHNALGTLLIAGLRMAGVTFGEGSAYDYESPESRLFESTVGDEGADTAWSNAVDWAAFDSARLEARGEKLADWLEEDADAAKVWIYANGERAAALAAVESSINLDLGEVETRCTETLDMFAGQGA